MRRFAHTLAIMVSVFGIIYALPALFVIAIGFYLFGFLFSKHKTENKPNKVDKKTKENAYKPGALTMNLNESENICPKCGKVFLVKEGKMREIKVGQVGSKWFAGYQPIYERRLVCPKCAGWSLFGG